MEKAKALVAALGVMALDDAIVANFYGDVAEQINAADPKDETGFAEKTSAKKRIRRFPERSFRNSAGKQDMKERSAWSTRPSRREDLAKTKPCKSC